MHCPDFYCTCFFCLTSSCVLFHLYCGTDVCTMRMQLLGGYLSSLFSGGGGYLSFPGHLLVQPPPPPDPHPCTFDYTKSDSVVMVWNWQCCVWTPLSVEFIGTRTWGTIHLFLHPSFPSSFSPPPFPSYSPPPSSSSCSPLPLLLPLPPLRPDITVMVDWA